MSLTMTRSSRRHSKVTKHIFSTMTYSLPNIWQQIIFRLCFTLFFRKKLLFKISFSLTYIYVSQATFYLTGFDQNGDGVISEEEFRAVMKKYKNSSKWKVTIFQSIKCWICYDSQNLFPSSSFYFERKTDLSDDDIAEILRSEDENGDRLGML